MPDLPRPKSLTDFVADQLRQDIVDGVYDFGQNLSEVAIAKRLSVSRTPVREAFSRLENERLVRSEPQRGTFVFSMTREELAAICDVRVMLEAGALRLGIETNRARLEKTLTQCLVKMDRAQERGDGKAYLRLDQNFHQALIECAQNPFLTETYQAVGPRMAAVRNNLGTTADLMRSTYAEHRAIATHIGKGEADAAVDVLTIHIGRREGSFWNR